MNSRTSVLNCQVPSKDTDQAFTGSQRGWGATEVVGFYKSTVRPSSEGRPPFKYQVGQKGGMRAC